jgi:hypothetical protein
VEPSALRVARALDLAPRIASRVDAGAGELAPLRADRALQAMAAEALIAAGREIAGLGVPMALLKGAALIARGFVKAGARPLADLDLLLGEDELDAVAGSLRGLGFATAPGAVPSDHQLPALARDGRVVELHRFLPGVRLPGARGFATLAALDGAGLLEPLAGWPGQARVPARSVLAAHAAVHGLVQHGLAPRSYPLTRMLADLVDLGLHRDPALAAAAHALVAAEIPSAEWDELAATCRDLEAGRGHERPLVAHAVHGLLDDAYAASLKLRALGAVPSSLPRPLALAREAWRALFPGRERLAALEPEGRARAVKRPFVMLGRGLRALFGRRA